MMATYFRNKTDKKLVREVFDALHMSTSEQRRNTHQLVHAMSCTILSRCLTRLINYSDEVQDKIQGQRAAGNVTTLFVVM